MLFEDVVDGNVFDVVFELQQELRRFQIMSLHFPHQLLGFLAHSGAILQT